MHHGNNYLHNQGKLQQELDYYHLHQDTVKRLDDSSSTQASDIYMDNPVFQDYQDPLAFLAYPFPRSQKKNMTRRRNGPDLVHHLLFQKRITTTVITFSQLWMRTSVNT